MTGFGHRTLVFSCVLVSLSVACGRTPLPVVQQDFDASLSDERCNGVDDDGDRKVDEDFRDEEGRYIADMHCGACGHVCAEPTPRATAMACGLVAEIPQCVASGCEIGYEVSRNGLCVSLSERACMSCSSDADCGSLERARCQESAGQKHCTLRCAGGCPDGFVCDAAQDACLPEGGDCSCDESEAFELACAVSGPDGQRCPGRQQCQDGRLTECAVDAELCDGKDNDCDGRADEDFVDDLGAYSRDAAHCGSCGVDCRTAASDTGVTLVCGGDPFAPACVVNCPDAGDGVQLGDRLDADRRIDNGCECRVTRIQDSAGRVAEEPLDSNCDGADGDVLRSYYVANDGDDSGPGSVSRPVRTIGRALELATASLSTDRPRPDVFVASGTYAENLRVPEGIALHGGYRRDFLALDPDGFETRVVATSYDAASFGAALVIGPGQRATLIEGLSLRGFDAAGDPAPAVGLYVEDAYAGLTLRGLRVQSGKPTPGRSGAEGVAGRGPQAAAAGGQPPRAAREDNGRRHACLSTPLNSVEGGAPGRNTCGSQNVSGGQGGGAGCPMFSSPAADGSSGTGPGAGPGGQGGTDVQGPIQRSATCNQDVCCGLADFTVPSVYRQAAPGGDGAPGAPGTAGAACEDALGSFVAAGSGRRWQAGRAAAGSGGAPGGGAGGGGAGGGVEMDFTAVSCEFADGLGGGGGGGGAGGCGGAGGEPGESGGPAIGVLIRARSLSALPRVEQLTIATESGGTGGDGGAGGDGGPGGAGGPGGSVPRDQLSTPTLAGAAPGESGGNGGVGGPGAAAGGGCGGSSVGVWLLGVAEDAGVVARMRAAASFALGAAGRAGRGGGGARPAAPGAAGMVIDVVMR